MGFVGRFRNDCFISYAHRDNLSLECGKRGWIAEFERRLRIRLPQLLGSEVEIWRDPRLSGADIFNEEIGDQLRNSALLIAILSLAWDHSKACQEELKCFEEATREQRLDRIGNRRRIIKVVKTPLPEDAHHRIGPETLGREFYARDPQSQAIREYPLGSEEFRERFEQVAQDVAGSLREMKSRLQGPEAEREAVFEAEVTSDLRRERERLRVEKHLTRDKVFICYSHEDASWLKRLTDHLDPFVADGVLNLWVDTEIEAGERWLEKIRQAIEGTKIAVLLISPGFLKSKFITDEEVPSLLKAAESEGVRLLPVFVRPSMVEHREYIYRDAKTGEAKRLRLTDLQGVNSPSKPLSSLDENSCEEMLVEIAEEILRFLGIERPESPGRRSSQAPSPPPDPRPYLEKMREENRYIDVRGIRAKAAERIELTQVYTRLRVAVPELDRGLRAGKDDLREMGEGRRLDHELSGLLGRHPHLVLIGDPGSGKTTFLRFVALNLARARLGEDPAGAMKRIGLEGEPPFPILARLADFASYLGTMPDPALAPNAPERFYRFLDHSVRGFDLGLPAGGLRRRVEEGGCMLVLDGIDEVPGEAARERVGRIVEQVVREGQRAGNRHLITSRTRAYEGRVQLEGDFTLCRLQDFGGLEIVAFVAQWCRALYRVPSGDEESAEAAEARRYETELLRAIFAHPDVWPMAANPLMLTVLAVVHWGQKRLPEQRAELYDEAVRCLLSSRREISPLKDPQRRECLQAIALRMFQDDGGVLKTLGRAEAAEVVGPILGVDRDGALAFLESEELHSGVLVSRSVGEVEFWHLTFQEYLAALELSSRDDWWKAIGGHLDDDRWRELILLLSGCLRRLSPRKASDLIRRVLAADSTPGGQARAVALIARIRRDVLPYGGDPARDTGYDEALGKTIGLFEPGAKEIPEGIRVEVGEALGQAGDPRLHDKGANRILVPGGTFWMGTEEDDPKQRGYDSERWDNEGPVHRVILSPFFLDRFPVTVQQFRRFVEAGPSGYLMREVWDPEGWTWRNGLRRTQPSEWEEQLRHPNRPVVRVSWYEADAYARWAGGRLPTEAEWEYAARGKDGRKYPWGNDPPTDRHANFEGRVGAPTPVGIYPLGATAEGVQDMAGNVWEWCADWYGAYPNAEAKDPAGPDQGSARVLRGGGFNYYAGVLSPASRYYFGPGHAYIYVGFRCAWSSAAGRK